MPYWRRSLVVAVLACLLGAGAASGTDYQQTVHLRVASDTSYGSPLSTADQLGTAPVTRDVVRASGGALKAGGWRNGSRAFDFPAFTWSSTPPRAVLRVTPLGIGDPLAPGGSNFSFGADFRKDSSSSGTSVDNGDNLIQRGLWGDSAQYKIEVDGGRPGCRIKGDGGSVAVRAPLQVDSRLWYRVRCSRVANTVTLTVKEYRADGTVRSVSAQGTGTIGRLTWPKVRTPLSVGGKLAPDGALIRSATDQFNGLVTAPQLRIDR